MTKLQSKYTQCLDVVACNPTALMQEISVTELLSPATWVFNILRPKKTAEISYSSLVCGFLGNLFRNFINVLLQFKGYDKKKDCICSGKCWGDLGSNIHKPII